MSCFIWSLITNLTVHVRVRLTCKLCVLTLPRPVSSLHFGRKHIKQNNSVIGNAKTWACDVKQGLTIVYKHWASSI